MDTALPATQPTQELTHGLTEDSHKTPRHTPHTQARIRGHTKAPHTQSGNADALGPRLPLKFKFALSSAAPAQAAPHPRRHRHGLGTHDVACLERKLKFISGETRTRCGSAGGFRRWGPL